MVTRNTGRLSGRLRLFTFVLLIGIGLPVGLIFAAASALGAPGSGPALQECGLAWRITPTENATEQVNYLYGVAAVSAGEVYAVGGSNTGTPATDAALIERWNGSGWDIVASPATAGSYSALYGVDAIVPGDAWAVGEIYTGTGSSRVSNTFVVRGGASAWTIVPSANMPGSNVLQQVDALSASDAWAVGSYANASTGVVQTLIERWNGAVWSIVPSPNVSLGGAASDNYLYDVTAISATDAWAVGYYDNTTTGRWETLALHWDGTSWSVVATPNVATDADSENVLYGVSAVAAGDVWAVGYSVTPLSGRLETLILHYTGGAWTVVESPNRVIDSTLIGVKAIAANDVWAVGAYGGFTEGATRVQKLGRSLAERVSDRPLTPDGSDSAPITLHWDGSIWSDVANPVPDGNSSSLQDVDAISSGDVWAVGFLQPELTPTSVEGGVTATPLRTLAERYNDPCAPTPTPTATATPGPCTLPFTDVVASDYFYDPVSYLYCRGVISGYSDLTFRPYNNTIRGQMTKIIVLAEGFPLVNPSEPTFTDVSSSNSYYIYVETAAAREIVSGYDDGTFRPFNEVTRGQLSKIVVIAEGWEIIDPPDASFRDVLRENPFYTFIETAYRHGIISGYNDGTFRWGSNATRGQIAKIVYLAVTLP